MLHNNMETMLGLSHVSVVMCRPRDVLLFNLKLMYLRV